MTEFAQHTKNWILSVCRVRELLIKSGACKINIMRASTFTKHLKTLLQANNYNDKQIARFFLMHIEQIEYIMPGKGSKQHETKQKQFSQIKQQATQLITQTQQYVQVLQSNE